MSHRLSPNRITHQAVSVGEAFQLSGATDRQQQIELTLDRLKADRIRQAEIESQQILDAAYKESSDLLAAAKERAERTAQTILQEAETQRDDVLQKGYEDGEKHGYETGYQHGLRQAEDETVALLENAQIVLDIAYTAQNKVLSGFEDQAAELIQHICHTVSMF